MGVWLGRNGLVMVVGSVAAAFATALALVLGYHPSCAGWRAAPAEREVVRREPQPPITPTLSHREPLAHIRTAQAHLEEAIPFYEAGVRPKSETLSGAIRALHKLEGEQARRAAPLIARIRELRAGPADSETAREVARLADTMEARLVGDMQPPPIDPEAVVAKARDSDDGYRCRLGMGYLLAARVEEEEERAEAYRQAGTALLRTVDGENRGLATFVLSELERADAPTTMNEDQAVSYAAWRCE